MKWLKRKLAKWKFNRWLRSFVRRGEWPDEYPEMKMTTEQKHKFVRDMMGVAAKPLLMTFKICELNEHMTITLYNEPTDEYFEFSLKKVTPPPKH